MRGYGKLTWVKIHIDGWLNGSIRWQLEPAERSVWADLIVMAGRCLLGGKICDNDGRAFPLDFIANQLHIPLELLESTLSKCKKEGRVEVKDGVIYVCNWKAYQSEYERKRQYRKPGPDESDPDRFVKGKYGKVVRR